MVRSCQDCVSSSGQAPDAGCCGHGQRLGTACTRCGGSWTGTASARRGGAVEPRQHHFKVLLWPTTGIHCCTCWAMPLCQGLGGASARCNRGWPSPAPGCAGHTALAPQRALCGASCRTACYTAAGAAPPEPGSPRQPRASPHLAAAAPPGPGRRAATPPTQGRGWHWPTAGGAAAACSGGGACAGFWGWSPTACTSRRWRQPRGPRRRGPRRRCGAYRRAGRGKHAWAASAGQAGGLGGAAGATAIAVQAHGPASASRGAHVHLGTDVSPRQGVGRESGPKWFRSRSFCGNRLTLLATS
mmetsp:Transcript_117667/g.327629  ORF Transcript_117667/g.327629 Transcript_117667/m.327629 type:complete len:300 (-) Transcript_117667:48-947(-)